MVKNITIKAGGKSVNLKHGVSDAGDQAYDFFDEMLSKGYENGGEVSNMTEEEFLKKYMGGNVYPKEITDRFEIESKSISNESRLRQYIADLQSRGFKVNRKSHSDFTSVKGVKLREPKEKLHSGGRLPVALVGDMVYSVKSKKDDKNQYEVYKYGDDEFITAFRMSGWPAAFSTTHLFKSEAGANKHVDDLANKYEAGGGIDKIEMPGIGSEIMLDNYGNAKNVKMKLIEIVPLSRKDIDEGLGEFSYHFKGGKGSQYYPAASLEKRIEEGTIKFTKKIKNDLHLATGGEIQKEDFVAGHYQGKTLTDEVYEALYAINSRFNVDGDDILATRESDGAIIIRDNSENTVILENGSDGNEKIAYDYFNLKLSGKPKAKHTGKPRQAEPIIKGAYGGQTAAQVWDAWTPQQRKHFLSDHKGKVKGKKTAIDKYVVSELPGKTFKDIPVQYKKALEEHVKEGQYAKGGHIGFKGLQNKVAKNYEGKPVPPKYRKKYGATYSADEAQEVGAEVAGKVKNEQQGKGRKAKAKRQSKLSKYVE